MPAPPIDVDLARAQTPGVANVAHLNNAGAALPPSIVTETVVDHLRREEAFGGYEAGLEVVDRHEAVYRSVAALVGGQPHEIALTDSATRAWDAAFYALAARLKPGQLVLTSRSEYLSNAMAVAQVAGRTGASLHIVEPGPDGHVDLEQVAATIDTGNVGLVCLTHVPTSGGIVEPAAEVGRLTRAAGVPYLLDACQSVGQMTVDVGAIGCDALTVTGRKFLRAPRGTGFLWLRGDLIESLEPPVVDLHAAEPDPTGGPGAYRWRDDARRFEQWEFSVAGRLGLGVAVDHALGWGLDAIEQRVVHLAERLRSELGTIEGVEVRDQGVRRSGIVTFTVDGHEPTAVADALRAQRVNVWQTPGPWAPLDLAHRRLDGVVRASVHYYNVDSELDRCCEIVAATARMKRRP